MDLDGEIWMGGKRGRLVGMVTRCDGFEGLFYCSDENDASRDVCCMSCDAFLFIGHFFILHNERRLFGFCSIRLWRSEVCIGSP